MVTSVGIDIVEIARITEMYTRYPVRFVQKLLSIEEQKIFNERANKEAFLAGRFACKEAIIKALGKYLEKRPSLSSLKIIPDNNNIPQLIFEEELHHKLKHVQCHISISHERTMAVGMAVFSEGK